MSHSLAPGAVIWILGASTGIGRALALAMAGAGLTVVASARRGHLLDDLANQAPGPGRIVAWPVDASDTQAVRDAAAGIAEQVGAIDLAIYGAAAWTASKNEPITCEDFTAKYDVNVMGAVRMLEAVLPAMQARGRGHVAIIASVAGYRGLPRAATYGSSKAALIYLCESLRLTLAPQGIKVQVINPGFVDTPLTEQNDFPMPFLISAERAADYCMRGLRRNGFEISFPKRFSYFLKFLSLLPYPLYFWLVGKTAGKG